MTTPERAAAERGQPPAESAEAVQGAAVTGAPQDGGPAVEDGSVARRPEAAPDARSDDAEAARARVAQRRERAKAATATLEKAATNGGETTNGSPAPDSESTGSRNRAGARRRDQDGAVVDLIARRNGNRRLRRHAAAADDLAREVSRRQVEVPDRPAPPLPAREKKSDAMPWLGRLKLRHRIIIASFGVVVALPSIIAAVYLFFAASDQYNSTFSFEIRSLSPMATTGSVLGMLTSNVSGTTTSDSYILVNYLQSQQGVEDIGKQLNLRKIFNHDADWYFRLGKDATIEDLVRYWNWMVNASFEPSTGIISVDVKAFSAADANKVAQAILDRSRTVVTTLSKQAREDAVSFAKNEVARAEMRLKFANREVQNFRNSEQEIDPTANVKVAMELIGSLQKDLTTARAEEKQLSGYLDKSSPTLQLLKSKISSLEKQLAEEQKVLGTGGKLQPGSTGTSSTLSAKVGRYQELEVEQGFAQKAYTTALAGLEKAEVEAAARDRFLATFVTPTLAQEAQYPRRIVYSLVVFGGLLILWGSAVLIVYNIRDRV